MRRFFVFLILALVGVALLAILSGQSLLLFSGNKQKTPAYSNTTTRAAADTPLSVFGNNDLSGVSISDLQKPRLFELDKNLQPYLQIEGETGKLARDKSLTIVPCKISFSRDNKNSPPLEIVATRTRAPVSGMPPKLSGGEPIVSDDAVVTYFGSESVFKSPVKISFPHLALHFRELNGGVEPVDFTSDDEFQLTGNLMKGSGKGVRGDLVREEIEIYQNPILDFQPGAIENLKYHVTLKSAGKAILASPRDWIPETTIDFNDSAFFRSESVAGDRFIEANANRIFVRMQRSENTTTAESTMRPRMFEASGDVLFRTGGLQGSCSALEGIINNNKKVEKLTLNGPYRIDFRTPDKARAFPRIGVPKNPLLSGKGKATFVLLNSENVKSRDYEMTCVGEPELTFTESETGASASIRAEKIVSIVDIDGRSDAMKGFRAIGRARIRTSLGTLDGDEIELIQRGDSFALRAVREYGAEFHSSENTKDKEQKRSSFVERHVVAREIVIEPEEGNKSVVVASGDARGWIKNDGVKIVTFQGNWLQYRGNSLEIKEKAFVFVTKQGAKNFKLYGDRLVFVDIGGTDSPASDPLANGNAMIFGSPALVEQYDEQNVLTQSLTSPEVTFAKQQIIALSPVEVSFPRQDFTGDFFRQKKKSESAPVWLSGSLLTIGIDAKGRNTKAILEGPITSRGSLDVRGEHLELDFITGEHFLIAKEGARVRVRSFEPNGSPNFLAEAPRLDFHTVNNSLTLIGLGTLEITKSAFTFGSILPANADRGESKTTVRFDTTGKVIISKESAQFLGNVVATGIDASGALLWKILCDLLTVSFDAEQRPSHIRAVRDVQFTVGNDLKGTCDELESDSSSEILELRSNPPRNAELDFGNLHFVGRWLKFNSRTLLVESGPATISSTRAAKTPASIHR